MAGRREKERERRENRSTKTCSSRERYTPPYGEISRRTRTPRRSPLHTPDVTSFPLLHRTTSSLSFRRFSFCIFLASAAACNFPRPSEFYDPGRGYEGNTTLLFSFFSFIHSPFSPVFFFLFTFVPFLFNSSAAGF